MPVEGTAYRGVVIASTVCTLVIIGLVGGAKIMSSAFEETCAEMTGWPDITRPRAYEFKGDCGDRPLNDGKKTMVVPAGCYLSLDP